MLARIKSLIGPEAARPKGRGRRSRCQQRGDQRRGGCSQALDERDRAAAGVNRVTLGDVTLANAPQVGDPLAELVQANGGEGDPPPPRWHGARAGKGP